MLSANSIAETTTSQILQNNFSSPSHQVSFDGSTQCPVWKQALG